MLIAGALIAQFAKHVWMVCKIKMRRILTVEDPTAVLVYQKTHATMESKMGMKKMSTVEGSSVPLVVETSPHGILESISFVEMEDEKANATTQSSRPTVNEHAVALRTMIDMAKKNAGHCAGIVPNLFTLRSTAAKHAKP